MSLARRIQAFAEAAVNLSLEHVSSLRTRLNRNLVSETETTH